MNIYDERIRPLFDGSPLTNAELERKIGIKPKTINKWNSGYVKSYDKYIPQIASYFHVSTDYLLGNTDDPEPPGRKERLPAQGGELSEKDVRLIQWFRSLPLEKQKAILIAQDGPADAAE